LLYTTAAVLAFQYHDSKNTSLEWCFTISGRYSPEDPRNTSLEWCFTISGRCDTNNKYLLRMVLHHSMELSEMVLHHFREVFSKLYKSKILSTDILVCNFPVNNKHKFEYLSPQKHIKLTKDLELVKAKWSVVNSSELSGY